jgi:hypothetical protein
MGTEQAAVIQELIDTVVADATTPVETPAVEKTETAD